MSLSHTDYLNIMKFYKIDVSNMGKKKIKLGFHLKIPINHLFPSTNVKKLLYLSLKESSPRIQGVHSLLCVFFKELSIFCDFSLASAALVAFGCTENSQSIRVTEHSDLRSD